jgi:hypothetical protein
VKSKIVVALLLIAAFLGLVPVTTFAAPTKLETTQSVLAKMGTANEVGEYLAEYTKLGNILDKVPAKAKKAKGFFDKASGPLSSAVDAALLYSYVRQYQTANTQTKKDIGAKVANKFYDLLSPLVSATPQGALIGVSVKVGVTLYQSMMASVAQYRFTQASSGLYAANAVLSGKDYIDADSPWYGYACWLFVEGVNTGTIYSSLTRLEDADPKGRYAQIAMACYKEGAGMNDIIDVIKQMMRLEGLNDKMARVLQAAEAQKYLAQLKAEDDKKDAAARRAMDQVKTAGIREKDNNKRTIQAKCKFSDAQSVWNAIDKHRFASGIYYIWANSYPSGNTGQKPNKSDRDIIQSFCKFGQPQAVWSAVSQHRMANELLKAWANSYYPTNAVATTNTSKPPATNTNTNTTAPTNASKPANTNTTTNTSKPTNADYQRTIQSRCGYQTQTDVWKAIDKITPVGDRDRVYKAWGESYNRSKPSSSQRSKSDKDLILDMCPDIRGISANVWKTIEANFANHAGLYKKWADSYRNM